MGQDVLFFAWWVLCGSVVGRLFFSAHPLGFFVGVSGMCRNRDPRGTFFAAMVFELQFVRCSQDEGVKSNWLQLQQVGCVFWLWQFARD